MAVDFPEPLSPTRRAQPPPGSSVCAWPWKVPQFQSSSRSSRKPDSMWQPVFSNSSFDMIREAASHFLQFRWAETSLQDSHYLKGLRLWGSKGSQERQLLETADGSINCSDIANLVVRFAHELADQLTQLLARQNQPGRVSGSCIEAGQFFAQTDQEHGSRVSE